MKYNKHHINNFYFALQFVLSMFVVVLEIMFQLNIYMYIYRSDDYCSLQKSCICETFSTSE